MSDTEIEMHPEIDLSSYVQQPPPPVKNPKKRKRSTTVTENKTELPSATAKKPRIESLNTFRKRLKNLCKDLDQWQSLRKMTREELQNFEDIALWSNDMQTKKAMVNSVVTIMGGIFDSILNGKGHISQEFKDDLSLYAALEEEMSDVLKLCSNKIKILILTMSDIYHGKQKQISCAPKEKTTEIQEENADTGTDEQTETATEEK